MLWYCTEGTDAWNVPILGNVFYKGLNAKTACTNEILVRYLSYFL